MNLVENTPSVLSQNQSEGVILNELCENDPRTVRYNKSQHRGL
jgi:hypothetical protein